MVRVAQQFIVPAQQAEIDPPGIDADAGDAARIDFARRLQARCTCCQRLMSGQYMPPAACTAAVSKR